MLFRLKFTICHVRNIVVHGVKSTFAIHTNITRTDPRPGMRPVKRPNSFPLKNSQVERFSLLHKIGGTPCALRMLLEQYHIKRSCPALYYEVKEFSHSTQHQDGADQENWTPCFCPHGPQGHLVAAGYRSIHSDLCPRLSPDHRHHHRILAHRHQHWNHQHWSHVLYLLIRPKPASTALSRRMNERLVMVAAKKQMEFSGMTTRLAEADPGVITEYRISHETGLFYEIVSNRWPRSFWVRLLLSWTLRMTL